MSNVKTIERDQVKWNPVDRPIARPTVMRRHDHVSVKNDHALVDRYFTMWNEPNAEERRVVVNKLWSDDAVSVDPVAHVTGHTEIGAMVSKFQEDYPGHTFALSGDIVEHHDRLRFHWRMMDPQGDVQLSGLDCVRLSDDGRIADLAGFFDATPA